MCRETVSRYEMGTPCHPQVNTIVVLPVALFVSVHRVSKPVIGGVNIKASVSWCAAPRVSDCLATNDAVRSWNAAINAHRFVARSVPVPPIVSNVETRSFVLVLLTLSCLKPTRITTWTQIQS
jgi:hypothetical protein